MRGFVLSVSLALAATLTGCGFAPTDSLSSAIPATNLSSVPDSNVSSYATSAQASTPYAAAAGASDSDVIRNVKTGLGVVFERLDRNRDGMLEPDELQSPAMFSQLDTNHDGVVEIWEFASPSQLSYFVSQIRKTAQQFINDSGSSTLSLQQVEQLGLSDGTHLIPNPQPIEEAAFRHADANQDGELDLAEATDYFSVLMAEGYGWGAPVSNIAPPPATR